MTPTTVHRLIDLLRGVLDEIREGADPRLPLELALVRTCRPQAELSVEALAQRLERLEAAMHGARRRHRHRGRPPRRLHRRPRQQPAAARSAPAEAAGARRAQRPPSRHPPFESPPSRPLRPPRAPAAWPSAGTRPSCPRSSRRTAALALADRARRVPGAEGELVLACPRPGAFAKAAVDSAPNRALIGGARAGRRRRAVRVRMVVDANGGAEEAPAG